MLKTFALVIVTLGLGGIWGCAQEPGDPAPVPQSTVMYARAAVEVGTIDITQMSTFEVSVERMNPEDRVSLWQALKQRHDSMHPLETAGHVAPGAGLSFEDEGDGGGTRADASCSSSQCSHSNGGTARWCCAFGEDAKWYYDR